MRKASHRIHGCPKCGRYASMWPLEGKKKCVVCGHEWLNGSKPPEQTPYEAAYDLYFEESNRRLQERIKSLEILGHRVQDHLREVDAKPPSDGGPLA